MLPKLYITANGVPLDLPEDAAISLSFNNPWIDKSDKVQASFSFPFTLPATPNNIKALEHPYRINKSTTSTTISNAIIGYDNTELFTGVLIVTNASERGIEVSFGVGSSGFYSEVKDKVVIDLDPDNEIDLGITSPADMILKLLETTVGTSPDFDYAYPAYPCVVFPVYNEQFIDSDTMVDYVEYAWPRNFQNYMKVAADNEPFYNYNASYIFPTPFVYLNYVIDLIISNTNYKEAATSFLKTDTELNSLVIYNNYDVYGLLPEAPYTFFLKNLIPEIKVVDFIKSIENYLNVYFDYALISRKLRIVDVEELILDPNYIDWTDGAEAYPLIQYTEKTGYTLKMATDANNSFMTIDEVVYKQIYAIKNSVADLTALNAIVDPVVDEVRFVLSQGQYYIYTIVDVSNTLAWSVFIIDFTTHTVGDGGLQIETKAGTLGMHPATLVNDNTGDPDEALFPRTDQRGNGPFFNGKYSSFSLRLLFYRGWQETRDGGYYPMGSSGIKNLTDDLSFNYSLFWKHKNQSGVEIGLAEKRYKNYLYWISNIRKTVKYRRYCSIADLQNLSFAKKYRIGQTNYFIQQLNVTLGMYKIEPAELTLAKV